VVGTGKVGRVLATLFSKAGAQVLWVCDRSPEKAKKCAAQCNAESYSAEAGDVDPRVTVLFLCVPDDDLEALASFLGRSGKIKSGMLLAHTSGALPASVLEPSKKPASFSVPSIPVTVLPNPLREIFRV